VYTKTSLRFSTNADPWDPMERVRVANKPPPMVGKGSADRKQTRQAWIFSRESSASAPFPPVSELHDLCLPDTKAYIRALREAIPAHPPAVQPPSQKLNRASSIAPRVVCQVSPEDRLRLPAFLQPRSNIRSDRCGWRAGIITKSTPEKAMACCAATDQR